MLACVCQPMETALLFNGGSPVTMGPLGTNGKMRHNRADVMKNIHLLTHSNQAFNTDAKDNLISPNSMPAFMDSSGSLLSLRKIERKTKSTKILVNPVCLDGVSSSDDSNRSKSATSKWNGKKKRLKLAKDKKDVNEQNECDVQNREEAKKDKKSISCFKIKSSDEKERADQTVDESYTNKNVTISINSVQPDVIKHTKKHCNELLEKSTCDKEIAQNKPLNIKKAERGAAGQNEVCYV
ncbi:unnamed protein product, partial [Iphiclides podalirius]